MIKEDFLRKRSIAGCLKGTLQTLTMNFATIFRNTYQAALLYAMACTCVMIMQTVVAMRGTMQPPVDIVVAYVALWVVMLGAYAILKAHAISLVNDNGFKKNRSRNMLFTGFQALAAIAMSLLIAGAMVAVFLILVHKKTPPQTISNINILVALGVTLLCLLIYVPFTFSEMKYINADGTVRLSSIFRSYGRGLRHYGYLLGVILLAGFVYLLAAFVAFLPLFIVYSALGLNTFGMMNGDPSGLPSAFPWIVAAASLIVFFLLALLSLWMFYNLFFAYTSIEVMEKEKQQLKAK